MSYKLVIGEAASKMHPEADLYIDNYLGKYGENLDTLGLQGEILDDPDEKQLISRLDTIAERKVEVITTLQGRYSMGLLGTVVNHLRNAGKDLLITVEPIPESIRTLDPGIPQVRMHRLMEASRSQSRQLRAFLCHASSDKGLVRNLYRELLQLDIDVWFDEESLLPGQDWDAEIRLAVGNSDVVLVCLSNRSVTKVGYVQKEIRHALDCADERPEGMIYIIPVKLEECEVPGRLRQWQWVNLWESGGRERLAQVLSVRAAELRSAQDDTTA